jgi:hypothetical protein
MFDAFPLKELARGNSDLHRPSVFPKPWHLRHWPTTRRRVHSRALRSYLTNTAIIVVRVLTRGHLGHWPTHAEKTTSLLPRPAPVVRVFTREDVKLRERNA